MCPVHDYARLCSKVSFKAYILLPGRWYLLVLCNLFQLNSGTELFSSRWRRLYYPASIHTSNTHTHTFHRDLCDKWHFSNWNRRNVTRWKMVFSGKCCVLFGTIGSVEFDQFVYLWVWKATTPAPLKPKSRNDFSFIWKSFLIEEGELGKCFRCRQNRFF